MSLEIWMLILAILLTFFHSDKSERLGANTHTVQMFIGDGTKNLMEIEMDLTEKMILVNKEMFDARDMLSEAAEDLAKYDEEIQDIILSKIDKVTEKGAKLAESAEIFSLYIQECQIINFALMTSLLYFISYMICTWRCLLFIASKIKNTLLMFIITMIGHILLLIINLAVYCYFFGPNILARLHPEAVMFSVLFSRDTV